MDPVYSGCFVCVFVSMVLGVETRACSMPGEHSTAEPCPNFMHIPYIRVLVWIMVYLHNDSCSGSQGTFLVILVSSSLGALW